MTLYARVVDTITISFEAADGSPFYLDDRVAYKVLPIWAATQVGFTKLWNEGRVQVSESTSFSPLLTPTTIPSSEFGTGIVGSINDVPGLSDALAAKADATALTSGLSGKANTSDVTSALAIKADSSQLATKADVSDLAAKADATTTTTALSGKQPLDSDLTSVAGLTPTDNDLLQRKSGAWVNRTPAQVKTDLALTKSDVALGSADNTSDLNKPVSAATQVALDTKADGTATSTALSGKQSIDVDLTAIAALTSAANKVPYATGPGTWTMADFTAAGRALVDDADAATQRGTLSAAKAQTLYLDDFAGATDQLKLAAAVTALSTNPGIIELGSRTYNLTATTTFAYPGQGLRGQGMGATFINYTGTGACFYFWDSTVPHDQSLSPGNAGPIGGFFLEGGANSNTNIIGLKVGDLSQLHIDDVFINGFKTTGAKAFLGFNTYTWCERAYIRLSTQNSTQGIVFDSAVTALSSWDYSTYILSVNCQRHQDGIVITGSTQMIGVAMQVAGNCGAFTTHTGCYFTVGLGGSDISQFQGELNMGVESAGDVTASIVGPKDINIGVGSAIWNTYGAIRFSMYNVNKFQAGSVTWASSIDFAGPVWAPSLNPNARAYFVSKPRVVDGVYTQGGQRAMRVDTHASAVNYFTLEPRPAGSSPTFGVDGTDANINMLNYPKGTGVFGIYNDSPGVPTIQAFDSAATANLNLVSKAALVTADGIALAGLNATPTAAGTTTLTIASAPIQVFTGSTTQTVKLPTTSVVAGAHYQIVNQSTGLVTVQSSGANTIIILATGASVTFIAGVVTPTAVADWIFASTKDAQNNISADAFIPGTTPTVTAAGTTTLTVDSTEVQLFTGSTTQTVTLPTTGIVAGQRYTIISTSSGTVTINASGGGTIGTITGSSLHSAVFVALQVAPTSTAHWGWQRLPTLDSSTGILGSTIVERDSSANVKANAFLVATTPIVTSGGTTTMAFSSPEVTIFTGSTTHTVTLPTTSIQPGYQYTIINASTGAITINSSAANLVKVLDPGASTVVTALVATPTTAAHWIAPSANTRVVVSLATTATLGAVAGREYVYLFGIGAVPTLPTAIGSASTYVLKNTTAGTITVATTSSQTIEGSTTRVLAAGDSVSVVSDNANWWIV